MYFSKFIYCSCYCLQEMIFVILINAEMCFSYSVQCGVDAMSLHIATHFQKCKVAN